MAYNRPISNKHSHRRMSSGIESLVQAEKMMQIAILLPCAAFVGWLLGSWLDHRFHQSWIGLAGIVFGGIAGMVHVIRMVLAAGPKSDVAEPKQVKDNRGS